MTDDIKVSYVRPDNWINVHWLRTARESRGLSKEELSNKSDISENRIRKMEQAEYYPSEEELSKLCASLNYPKEFFLQEKDPVPTPYHHFNK